MGINKNYLKATVGLTLAVSSVPIFAPIYTEAATFSDVPQSAYYSDAVHVLAERGIINGYEDVSFKPDVVATRGQTAKILAGILGLDTINVVDPGYTDVLPDNPFYGAIAALVQAGIINGYEDHTFRMNEPLQRNHLAKILVKAFDLKSPEGATMPLTDAHKAYKDYILALYTNGITTGKTDTLFDGESYVTRGQLAAFVVRTEEVVQAANDKEQPDVDPIPPVEPIPTPNPSLTFTLSIEGMSDLFSTVTEYELKTSSVIGTLYLEGDVVKITFVSEEVIPKESFKTKINGVEYEFKFNKNENNWGAKKVKEAISTVPDSTLPPEPEPTPPTTPKPPSTVSVTGITLGATNATINQGDTAQLTASILPTNATNKNVTWTSSDENVVTVDSQGKVTAIGVGTATITATTVDGLKTATATIEVVIPVTASSNGIANATGTTTITLGKVIPGLTASDIVVKKDGTALPSTAYSLGSLTGTTVDITFDATAGLTKGQVITVEITKAGYTINGGTAIVIANMIDALPIASNVSISGVLEVGNTLTGNYVYSDLDGDLEDGTTYQWYADGVLIVGANLQTYSLTDSELGKIISFGVIPKNSNVTGEEVKFSNLVNVSNNSNILRPVIGKEFNSGQVVKFSNNAIELRFEDNLDWENSIVAVYGITPISSITWAIWGATITPGRIELPYPYGNTGSHLGLWKIIIKAKGYPDTVIDFIVQ